MRDAMKFQCQHYIKPNDFCVDRSNSATRSLKLFPGDDRAWRFHDYEL